jgi:hypothetical protein
MSSNIIIFIGIRSSFRVELKLRLGSVTKFFELLLFLAKYYIKNYDLRPNQLTIFIQDQLLAFLLIGRRPQHPKMHISHGLS